MKIFQQKIILLLEKTNDAILPLNAPSVEHRYNFYQLLHGIMQHDTYHLGQIALLKK
jgi:uncharacterized damage-inducible protein DinB